MHARSKRRNHLSRVDKPVAHFQENRHLFEIFSNSLVGAIQRTPALASLLHSIRSRVKDPDSLRRKLLDREEESKKQRLVFDINARNLFEKVNDLAGVRLLHLNTAEIGTIKKHLLDVLTEHQYRRV